MTGDLLPAPQGDRDAADRLFARVYDELKRLAHQVRGGRGHSLTTTALVHEAYLKLVPANGAAWEGRAHFFGAAARAMRQILVDAARRQLSAKRGRRPLPITLDEEAFEAPIRPERFLALDEALARLARIDPRRAEIVEHRMFAGLTTEETANVLGVGTSTVERDWRAARAWLALELGAGDP
jgi:RNA polymerase sigma factor (TIGR02999 family)